MISGEREINWFASICLLLAMKFGHDSLCVFHLSEMAFAVNSFHRKGSKRPQKQRNI